MEVVPGNTLLPGDPRLIDHIVCELKSQGIFDQFRKECIADVDTKPAYQNLRQRVEGSVTGFLKTQTWKPDMNKNQLREALRKNIYESGFLETGVERIVDQVVNPKINAVFVPQVEDVVYKFLGLEKPTRNIKFNGPLTISTIDLLPTDLDPISPDSEVLEKSLNKSDRSNDLNLDDSKTDDYESPPFEPITNQNVLNMEIDDSSNDSKISGISGLTSHDSNLSERDTNLFNQKQGPDIVNPDSQLSKVSSNSRLSIITNESKHASEKMDISDDTQSNPNDIFSLNFENKLPQNGFEIQQEIKDELEAIRMELNGDAYRSEPVEACTPPLVKTVEPTTETTEAQPIIDDTQPKLVETDPEVDKTDPKVDKTDPKVDKTDPKVDKTDPKVDKTDPKPDETEPKVDETKPEETKLLTEDKPAEEPNKTIEDPPLEDKTKEHLPEEKKDDPVPEKIDDQPVLDSPVKPEQKKPDKPQEKSEKSERTRSDSERKRDKYSEKDKKSDRDKDKRSSSSKSSSGSKDKDKEKSRDKSKDNRSKESSSSKSKDAEKHSSKDKSSEKTKEKSSSSSSKHSSRDKLRSESKSDSKTVSKTDLKESKDSKDSKSSHSSRKESSKKPDDTRSRSEDSRSKDDPSKRSSKSSSSSKSKESSKSSSSKDRKSSSSQREKKDPKKGAKKDDHSSSKEKKDVRRSADRDSNDGSSGVGNTASGSKQSNSNSSTSSSKSKSDQSDTNSNSDNSGQSDAILSYQPTSDTQENSLSSQNSPKITTLSLPQTELLLSDTMKIKKPKFASNIFEARKLMKIRKKMKKQQRKLELAKERLDSPPVDLDSVEDTDSMDSGKLQIVEDYKTDDCASAEEQTKDVPVVNKATWDEIEKKLSETVNQNVDFDSYTDKDDSQESLAKGRNKRTSKRISEDEDCLYFNNQVSPTTERFLKSVETYQKSSLPPEKTKMAPPNPDKPTKRPRKANLKQNQLSDESEPDKKTNKKQKPKGRKRKNDENDDYNENNNKKLNNTYNVVELAEEYDNAMNPSPSASNTSNGSVEPKKSGRKKKKNKLDFPLPLSPDSDISGTNFEVKNKMADEKDPPVTTRNARVSALKSQRYSSDDLYKPRPFVSGSSRRQRGLLNADKK